MSKLVSLPAAMQLEFNVDDVCGGTMIDNPLFVSLTCQQCVNDCKIYTISETAEVFCIKYQKN